MSEMERQAIARARERADLARMRFSNVFDGAVRRFTPDRLRADAVDAATDQFESLKQHLLLRLRNWPIVIGSVVTIGTLAFFWKPARAAIRHGLRVAQIAWATRHIWSSKR